MAKKTKAEVEAAPKKDEKLPAPKKDSKKLPKAPEAAHVAWAKKIKGK